ncbi:uncharacterized protein LOC141858483 [Brevipalpus obovatus]|uniref:uncharacterized protein LOC141858483 n=1 Tax=Brevipalpus obovatus TaxID=246614 RepID=UPI003D9DCF66
MSYPVNGKSSCIFNCKKSISTESSLSCSRKNNRWFKNRLTKRTELVSHFPPLFLSMTLVGLEYVNSRVLLNPKRWSLRWNYFILCLVSASLIHNICVQIFLFYLGEANSAFYTLFSITKLIGSLMILAIFYTRKPQISHLFTDIEIYLHKSPQDNVFCISQLRPLNQLLTIDVAICWLSMILFIYTNIASNSGDDLTNYLRDYFFGLNITRIPEWMPVILLSVETSIYFLATAAPTQFFSLYYVLLCRLVTILFQSLNNRIRFHLFQGKKVDHTFVQNVRSSHNRLTSMVDVIDERLSFLAFLQYIILMSDLSKYVYYLIDRLTRRWEDNYEIMFVVLRVAHMIFLFVHISFCASQVSEESVASIVELQDISTEICSDEQDWQQLQLIGLLMKMHTTPSQLTGWNLFVINRGFVLTVLGVVLTYSLVLFQMTPWAQMKTNDTKS